jgi:hypothetical protein
MHIEEKYRRMIRSLLNRNKRTGLRPARLLRGLPEIALISINFHINELIEGGWVNVHFDLDGNTKFHRTEKPVHAGSRLHRGGLKVAFSP